MQIFDRQIKTNIMQYMTGFQHSFISRLTGKILDAQDQIPFLDVRMELLWIAVLG